MYFQKHLISEQEHCFFWSLLETWHTQNLVDFEKYKLFLLLTNLSSTMKIKQASWLQFSGWSHLKWKTVQLIILLFPTQLYNSASEQIF